MSQTPRPTSLDRIKQLEDENREIKENLEFVSIEARVMSDALRETEEQLAREKKERKIEKESLETSLEELASRSKTLYDKIISKK